MNYKRFKWYIVVDQEHKPMRFEKIGKNGGQFCYCDTEDNARPFAIETYTYNQAKKLIKDTIEWRKKKKYTVLAEGISYFLMPIENKK